MDILYSSLLLILLASFLIPAISMAPWVPTRKQDIQRLLWDVKIPDGGRFLEIGSWDARVSLQVAKHFPNAHIVGIEYAFPLFCIGYILSYIQGKPDNLSLKIWDAFRQDFGLYDVIYVYGMPEKMQDKIVPQFLKEAKKGAKLYSYVFSIPEEYQKDYSLGWENEAKIHILEKK